MTWTFSPEITAIKNGWITHLGFVSEYQKNYLLNEYSKQLPDMCIDGLVKFGERGFPHLLNYSPYLDITQFEVLTKTDEYFGVGRVSRADPGKYSTDCWRIFDRVLTPGPKKTYILGYSDDVGKKIGLPPDGLDWQWWTAGTISTQEFYSKIDVMIHKTGGSRESYCRVLVEAMAHGLVPLVERAYAFPEILSKSDYLAQFIMCDSSDEMSFKASQLAFNRPLLRKYKAMCRQYAEDNFSNPKLIDNWKAIF
jgi:glycosyltransferase involved in cell wall biosynthesis